MKYIIYIINILLALLILRYEYFSITDKSLIVTSLLYGGLIALNLIVGFALRLDKKDSHKHFYRSALIVVKLAAISSIA